MPCDNSTGLCNTSYLAPCTLSNCTTPWVDCDNTTTTCSFAFNTTFFNDTAPVYDSEVVYETNSSGTFYYYNSSNTTNSSSSSSGSSSSSSYTANLDKPAKQTYDSSQGGKLKYKDSYQNDVDSITSNTTEPECKGRNTFLLV